MEQEYASTLLENTVTQLSRLPGIGRKTALRLALHILRQDENMGIELGRSIIDLRKGIKYCSSCHNISESDMCPICSNPNRDKSTVCVVESVKDVMSFENTGQYSGVYHVLGGVISPMDGIGPDSLEIKSLVDRVKAGYRQLGGLDVKITQLARGVSVGNEIEYTDEITLGRSLLNRTLFSDSFNR